MNKYLILGIVIVLIVGGAIAYSKIFGRGKGCPKTGVVREIVITAKKNEWRFVPEEISVECGDTVSATVVNEDDYDHGIGIQALGVNERMPALGTINLTFTVMRTGDFPFFCSVPCGEGVVEGKKRSHFDMVGKIHVQSTFTTE